MFLGRFSVLGLLLLINTYWTESRFHRLPGREQPLGVVSILLLCSDKSEAATELKIHRMSTDEDQNCGNHSHERAAWQSVRDFPFSEVIYRF